MLGCNPIRKEPRSLACLSRVGCPDEIRNRGFGSPTLEPLVLWGGPRGEGGSGLRKTVMAVMARERFVGRENLDYL